MALTPGDAEGWDELGRIRQWDFLDSDLPGAIDDYWKAVHYDPRSAHFWIDLAEAYEANGDDARARRSPSGLTRRARRGDHDDPAR